MIKKIEMFNKMRHMNSKYRAPHTDFLKVKIEISNKFTWNVQCWKLKLYLNPSSGKTGK